MKKFNSTITMMMEMGIWLCQMCMCFCALISDIFSISKAKHIPA